MNMKIKLTRIERIAGLFVICAIFLSGLSVVVVAIQKGWFEPKVRYRTTFQKANGIFPGTVVEISGLRAGAVSQIELKGENEVLIEFYVQQKFAQLMKSDSVVMSRRPFIIGDKILEVSVGSNQEPPLQAMSLVKSREGIDLLELGDPQRLAPFLDTFGRLTASLMTIADAFADPSRSKTVVEIFDKINPFLTTATTAAKTVVTMGDQMTRKKNLQIAMENFAAVSQELSKMLIEMPNMGQDLAEMLRQTTTAVRELNKVLPVMAQAAPQIPAATDKAMRAMEEAVVVLRAMQKSFLLRGSVKEVKEEDDKMKAAEKSADDNARMPAVEIGPVEIKK